MNMKRLKQIGWIVVMVAVLCSFSIWAQRIHSEQGYKNVQMVVNYSDLEAFANANQLTVEELGQMVKERGVSAILYKEWSLGDLANEGQVSLQLGYNIQNQGFWNQVSSSVPINNATMYVALLDKEIADQVRDQVLLKVSGAQYYPGDVAVLTLPVMVPNGDGELSTINTKTKAIGVGFDKKAMETMAQMGFATVPQLRSWDKPTDASLKEISQEIKAIPNLAYLLFNDKEVPGYPKSVRTFADCLKDSQGNPEIMVGSIEFSDQNGLNTLAVLLNKNLIRLHTISNGEMGKFTMDSAIDRWMLAARERNMRSLLVRFFDMSTPATSLQDNLVYLEALQDSLLTAGFLLDQPYEKPASIPVNNIVLLLVGIGVAAGVMLVLLEMGLPKIGVAVMLLAIFCWGGLLFVSPIMAKKIMSLVSVITFPTLACLTMFKFQKKTLVSAVLSLIKTCAISYIGAILMVGMMADVLFMLKLDQFSGVKIAHIIPILVVPFVLYIWNTEKPLFTVKELLAKTLDYKWTALFGVIAIAGMIYISRTGNTSVELSSGEAWMRNFLNTVLGVRPRTKEFLIGYPVAVLLFWLGAEKEKWILTIPAIIGQVSLVNTYAHIHTPLLISLQRSVEGLIIGIVFGILLVVGVKLLFTIYHRIEQSEGKR